MEQSEQTFGKDLQGEGVLSNCYGTTHSGRDVVYKVVGLDPKSVNDVIIDVYDARGRLITPGLAVPNGNLSIHSRASKELSQMLDQI